MIEITTPCILWSGRKDRDGYGRAPGGSGPLAHRVEWERKHGPIPKQLEIDHLCRVRACINPEHMELVTHAENIRRRDEARAAFGGGVSHCKAGHPYSGTNLYVLHGHRYCRACNRARVAAYQSRKRQAKQLNRLA